MSFCCKFYPRRFLRGFLRTLSPGSPLDKKHYQQIIVFVTNFLVDYTKQYMIYIRKRRTKTTYSHKYLDNSCYTFRNTDVTLTSDIVLV